MRDSAFRFRRLRAVARETLSAVVMIAFHFRVSRPAVACAGDRGLETIDDNKLPNVIIRTITEVTRELVMGC